MTFKEFVNKLFIHCGNGKNPAAFLRDFIENIVDEYNEKIINKAETEYRKYFNGGRPFPKKSISYVSSHMENEKFEDFILNNTNDDVLVELCLEFENELGVSTKQDIARKICSLFRTILNNSQNTNIGLSTPKTCCIDLENEIAEVIKKIANTPPKDLDAILQYEPYNVDKKIENKNIILKNDVRNYVIKYYSYIEDLFKEMSKQDTTMFDRLAKEIKYKSDNLIKENTPQEEVFNRLVNWLKNKATTTQDTACRIIIAFFVQNCEVFHEITE